MTDASAIVYELKDHVAYITIDDGKANALSHPIVDDLIAAVSRAETEAKVAVIGGRPGKFSAGFDLETMNSGQDNARKLLGHGAELFFQIFMLNIPTIVACTGHALAGGAVILLAADVRIGEDVPAKIGFPEVAIGMSLPRFILELAKERLSKRHVAGLNLAKLYDAPGALDAGYLDEVVAEGQSVTRAAEIAEQFTQLHQPSFVATRLELRGPAHDRITSTLAEDLTKFTVA